MTLRLPEQSLVLLIGPSSSGKTTFSRRHFGQFECVSSDFCRALVSNDENSMTASADAFEVLHVLIAKRLARGLLTVVDATNVAREWRGPYIDLARAHQFATVAIVFDIPREVCLARNRIRTDRPLSGEIVGLQHDDMMQSLGNLAAEGFDVCHVLRSVEEVDSVQIVREPLRRIHESAMSAVPAESEPVESR